MTTLELILVAVAVLIVVVAVLGIFVRVFPGKGENKHEVVLVVGATMAAIAAAVGGFILFRWIYDGIADNAAGSQGWASNGALRLILILAVALLAGYWVWYWVKRKQDP